jgi:hypothetical protein
MRAHADCCITPLHPLNDRYAVLQRSATGSMQAASACCTPSTSHSSKALTRAHLVEVQHVAGSPDLSTMWQRVELDSVMLSGLPMLLWE